MKRKKAIKSNICRGKKTRYFHSSGQFTAIDTNDKSLRHLWEHCTAVAYHWAQLSSLMAAGRTDLQWSSLLHCSAASLCFSIFKTFPLIRKASSVLANDLRNQNWSTVAVENRIWSSGISLPFNTLNHCGLLLSTRNSRPPGSCHLSRAVLLWRRCFIRYVGDWTENCNSPNNRPGIVSVVAAAATSRYISGAWFRTLGQIESICMAKNHVTEIDSAALENVCVSVCSLAAASWLLTWDSVVLAALMETKHKWTAPVRLGDYAPAPQLVNGVKIDFLDEQLRLLPPYWTWRL